MNTWTFAVPVWSGVNVAGVRLRDINSDIGKQNDTDCFNDVHKQVVERYKISSIMYNEISV